MPKSWDTPVGPICCRRASLPATRVRTLLRRPTGRLSQGFTGNSPRSRRRRSWSSIVRSRSRCCLGLRLVLKSSMRLRRSRRSRAITSCQAFAGSCSRSSAGSMRRAPSSNARQRSPKTNANANYCSIAPQRARADRSAAHPRVAWRLTEGAFVGAGELARRGEAGGDCHVEHRQSRLPQKLPRAFKPHRRILPVNAVAEVAAEQALELPHRHTGDTRKLGTWLRRLDVALHAPEHAQQFLVGNAESQPEIHALRAHALADVRVQEPVADRGGKLAAMIALDQSHHHVEGRDAARAGDAVAVDFEQRWRDGDIREIFAECRLMLPMKRHAAAVEKAGAGEDIRSAGDAADGHAAAGELAEPGKDVPVVEGGRIASGADEKHVDVAVGADPDIGNDG